MSPEDSPDDPRNLGWAEAQLCAWAILAIASAAQDATREGLIAGGARTRVLQCLFGSGQMLAAGVVIGALTFAFRARASRGIRWTAAATLAASFTLGWSVLPGDFEQILNRLSTTGVPQTVWRIGITLAFAVLVPVALLAGRLVARRSRSMGVTIGIGMFVFQRNDILPRAFPGGHLMLAIACASFIAASLAGAWLPGRLAELLKKPGVRIVTWVVAADLGALAVFVSAPMQVSFEMLRPPVALLAPFIAELHAPPLLPYRTPDEVRAALSLEPAAPPSPSALVPLDAVVVLVTIDCLRADLVADDARADVIPNLVALRRASAHFTEARTPGNQTIVALSSMFTGRYESQLAWTDQPVAHTRYLLPVDDPSPRFPERLAAAGIPSAAISGFEWMSAENGLLRGFGEVKMIAVPPGRPSSHGANGEDIVDASIERLERHGAGPLFLYVHLLDAHAPYDRGGVQGTPRERYLRELTIADREIGRLLAAVERRFGERALVVVSADHGEGFDEHDSSNHGSNVYEEIVRVPLLVRGPGIAARAIDGGVSLIDLGPTVLDLFRLPTPATFMGQSLVPALAGQPLARARPIAIEARGHVALIDGGWKVIRRKRHGIVELYDLGTDPREANNLFRETDPAAVARLEALRAFFMTIREK